MYYRIKEKREDNGSFKETYINTKLDGETVFEIVQAIEACADFSLYECFRNAYCKAWKKLLDILETETDDRSAMNNTSIIMSRARLEAS